MKCCQIVLFATFKYLFCTCLIYHCDLDVLSVSLQKWLSYIVLSQCREHVVFVAKIIYQTLYLYATNTAEIWLFSKARCHTSGCYSQ